MQLELFTDLEFTSQAPKPRAPKPFGRPEGMAEGLGNCGIVATAMLAGVSYDRALQEFRKLGCGGGRKMGTGRGQWSGGTHQYQRKLVLEALGFEVEMENLRKRKQVKTIVRQLDPNTPAMLRFSGHAFIMYQGKVWDQIRDGIPAEKASFAKCLVTSITTVKGKEQ